MTLPFKGLFVLTQLFGVNPENYSKFTVLYPDGIRRPMKGHNGLDFATPHRTEIVAPHDGEIIETNSDPLGYGWYVKIENDVEGSVMAHMDTIDVKVGYKLKESDHIGWSDNTGNSTGPHCHWGYYRKPRDRSNGFGGFVDQTPYLEALGIHLELGKLPEVDSTVITPEVEQFVGEYKGIDLNNQDSVKAAIDAWFDVAHNKYRSAEEYQNLETQFNTVKGQLENIQKLDANVSVDIKNYNELKAMGYTTIDDVTQAIKDKDDANIALQTEIAQVRGRNATLATEIAKMEEEDRISVELGQEASSENVDLKKNLLDLAKVTGADDANYKTIMNRVFNLKDVYDRFVEASNKEIKEPEAVRKVKEKFSYNVNWFLDKLQLRKEAK